MVRTAALVVALVGSASGFITPSPKLAAPLARSHVRASPTMVFGGFGRNGGLGGGGAGGRRFRGPFRNGNKNNNKGGVGNGGAGGSAGNGGKGNNGDVTAWMGGDDSGDGAKKTGLAGMLAVYEGWCETSPLLTKGVTSMIGFTLGDLLAQFAVEKTDNYEWYRTFRLATFGLLVHGTTGHWFYGKLDGYIPGKGAGAVASKVFIDQVLWNPIFGIMFFGYMGAMSNMGVSGTINEIKTKLYSSVTGSWTVWPIAHTINFRFVPTQSRILYINTIQIFYNCFLSILASNKKE